MVADRAERLEVVLLRPAALADRDDVIDVKVRAALDREAAGTAAEVVSQENVITLASRY
jgi:hypothetical protein